MTEPIHKLLIGSSGIIGAEAVQHLQLPTSTETKDIISIIVQIAIAIATIIGLFKKKKSV